MPETAVRMQLEKLKQRYTRDLPEKVTRIESAITALLTTPWDEMSCSSAHRLVHSLTGSSGTYGFPEISTTSRSAERILRQSLETRTGLAEPQLSLLKTLLSSLRELAEISARGCGA